MIFSRVTYVFTSIFVLFTICCCSFLSSSKEATYQKRNEKERKTMRCAQKKKKFSHSVPVSHSRTYGDIFLSIFLFFSSQLIDILPLEHGRRGLGICFLSFVLSDLLFLLSPLVFFPALFAEMVLVSNGLSVCIAHGCVHIPFILVKKGGKSMFTYLFCNFLIV